MGNFLLSASTSSLLDEKRFPFLRQFLPHPEQAVDLTLDEDEDDEDGEDATEVSWLMNVPIIPCFNSTESSLIDRPLPNCRPVLSISYRLSPRSHLQQAISQSHLQ